MRSFLMGAAAYWTSTGTRSPMEAYNLKYKRRVKSCGYYSSSMSRNVHTLIRGCSLARSCNMKRKSKSNTIEENKKGNLFRNRSRRIQRKLQADEISIHFRTQVATLTSCKVQLLRLISCGRKSSFFKKFDRKISDVAPLKEGFNGCYQ
jgi:hypothetical protein